MTVTLSISKKSWNTVRELFTRLLPWIMGVLLTLISVWCFIFYLNNGLGLAYNDARSHLDIGRRVVEGLKPGLAQLGSVWLPLPHVLMLPTVWNDYFWHTGLSGALQSMVSFILTSFVIFRLLRKFELDVASSLFGVFVFASNLNILYLQSTAMTELLLLATTTMGVYELIRWHQVQSLSQLMKAALWIMLSTLVRYDGWFLFFMAAMIIVLNVAIKHGKKVGKTVKEVEGIFILFCTLAGFGVFLWFIWNAAIFKDPLYFVFGPFSAHAQQMQLNNAGVLQTKGNWGLATITYLYALVYNVGFVPLVLGFLGSVFLFLDKKINVKVKLAASALFAPLIFNVLALFQGHSVLFVQNLNGNTWFNVRYGIMMMPSIAVFAGFLFDRIKKFRPVLVGVMIFFAFFQIAGWDAVTIDDGRVGSSQKNVSEVSGWLASHVKNEEGFVLISAASHDAIIFSSRLPMKRFIHEGTGTYWQSATAMPDRWARWIVMRTNDINDQTFRLVNLTNWQDKYTLTASYPFADIYELRPEFLPFVNTKPVLPRQR